MPKSTILKLVCGLIYKDKGSIYVKGYDLDNKLEEILGLGKKQLLDISKCLFISNLQLDKTVNLLKSFVLFFARNFFRKAFPLF